MAIFFRNLCIAALLSAAISCGDGKAPVTAPPEPPTPPGSTLSVRISGAPILQHVQLKESGFIARLIGPSIDTSFTTSISLNGVETGSYSLIGGSTLYDSTLYVSEPDTMRFSVVAGDRVNHELKWTPASGSLVFSLTGGPPDTTHLSALLQAPDGSVSEISIPGAKKMLEPGRYLVFPQPKEVAGILFTPTRSVDTINVSASSIQTVFPITYQTETATLILVIHGIGQEEHGGNIIVKNGNEYQYVLPLRSDTLRLEGLKSGIHEINADSYSIQRAHFTPTISTDTISISAGERHYHTISFVKNTANLSVSVDSVPESATAEITITGPSSFLKTIHHSSIFKELIPGNYSISAKDIVYSGHTYKATISPSIVRSQFADTVASKVEFKLATGAIRVEIFGIPDHLNGDVTVRSTLTNDGFSWHVLRSESRTNLEPGIYAISAEPILRGDTLYIPRIDRATVQIAPSLDAQEIRVEYVATTKPILDYAIDNIYLTQATQRPDGGTPLVENRDALLRVFVTANQGNSERLPVIVRLFKNGLMYSEYTIQSDLSEIPQRVVEGDLSQSWNIIIPASDVVNGMSVVAELGMQGVTDADPSNNRWPTHSSFPVDVKRVSQLKLRFVPIYNSSDSLTGEVNTSIASSILEYVGSILPIKDIVFSVRAPFTSTAGALLPNDSNNAWSRTLNEIQALRLMEMTDEDEIWIGVLATKYDMGIGGLATIGGKQALVRGSRSDMNRVLAHELGHIFGRYHSQGCGASFTDPSYPYARGIIGVWGWTGTVLVDPSVTNDIMGYCADQWISDFTWTHIMRFRDINYNASAFSLSASRIKPLVTDSIILISGVIHNDTAYIAPTQVYIGNDVIEEVRGSSYSIDMLDSANTVIASYPFRAEEIDHFAEKKTFATGIKFTRQLDHATSLTIKSSGRVIAKIPFILQ